MSRSIGKTRVSINGLRSIADNLEKKGYYLYEDLFLKTYISINENKIKNVSFEMPNYKSKVK